MKNEEAINALYEQLKSNFLETHHQGARYLSLVPAYNEDDGEHYRFRAYAIREGDEVEFLDDLHQTRQPLYRIEWDIDRDAIA